MKMLWMSLCILGVGLLGTGCSSVPGNYRPETLGMAADGFADAGLSIRIEPDRHFVNMGEPILFKVTYRNIGTRAFLLPNDPRVLFVWTYSNGSRDNFLMQPPEPTFYSLEEVVELAPGEGITRHFPVKTYYFDHRGITEFRAILRAGHNTNPDLENVWAGKAYSNAYGVMVGNGNRYALLKDGTQVVANP